jgi:hypothetical protein
MSPRRQPPVDGATGGGAVGHRALLAPLAEHPHDAALVVDVVDVEADQLAHPDPGGVEELEHRHVAQARGRAVVGEIGGGPDQRLGLVGAEHRRERLVLLG